ncbi:MAG: DUF2118 domain-containing protein [Caldanaerobacter sp.]
MKKFRVTVNGKTYEVEVEEIKVKEERGDFGETTEILQQSNKEVTVAESSEKTETKAKTPTSSSGSKVVSAPMPGTILDVRVKEGDRVKRGDVLVILEAMKMENEIMAPEDGIVVSVNVSKGASVNTGDVLVTME